MVGIGQFVIDFTFDFREDATTHRDWNFEGDYMHEGDYISWEIEMFGGLNKVLVKHDDPIAIDDRGLWFDGLHHFLSITGLTLHHTFNMSGWVKPHGAGILFDSSREASSEESIQRALYLGVSEFSISWADTFHHSYSQFNAIAMYEW
jgi:hypothetical protein